MSGLGEGARSYGTGKYADNSQPGTEPEKASLPTWSPEEEAELTQRQIANGRVEGVTAGATTLALIGLRLSATEHVHLSLMKLARRDGYMLSMADCDKLIAWVNRALLRG